MPGQGSSGARVQDQGKFMVLEGVDGAGTTTQSLRLAENLRNRGLSVVVTCEPSKGQVGRLLRRILAGQLEIMSGGGSDSPSWNTMALLFAADRLDHLQAEVIPNLAGGVQVVCDRYYHSSLAYQSVTGGRSPEMIEWILEINKQARHPDLTIILDVSPEVARERRSERHDTEIYERDGLQRELCEFYRNMEHYFPDQRVCHVDANRSFEQVAEGILECVESICRVH